MHHYTYIITYKNGMSYIGVRTCKCLPEQDTNYLGSSKHTPNEEVVDKKILGTFPSRLLAVEHEILLHAEHDVVKNPKFYNRSKQTATSYDTTGLKLPKTDEHKRNIAQALTGRKRTKEECENISKGKLGKKLNKPHSAETRQKISAAKMGHEGYMKGRTYSEEDRVAKYASRTVDTTKYWWINKDTGEQKQATYSEMGYLYGPKESNVKPPAPFRKMVLGKQKAYKGWSLNTDNN